MTIVRRLVKRIMIVVTVACSIGFLGIVWHVLAPPKPTCTDGKQNQAETGIDCGGQCAACQVTYVSQELLEVQETALVKTETGKYDVMARVHNPNDELGLKSFRYTFTLYGSSGHALATRTGMSAILPQAKLLLLEFGMEVSDAPTRVEVTFDAEEWQKFAGFQEKPHFVVANKQYEILQSQPYFSRLTAVVTNESVYDYGVATVKMVLRDTAKHVVALNQTEIRTFLSKEVREVTVTWPVSFPGSVDTASGIDVDVDTDVYHEGNILKRNVGEDVPSYR